MELLNHIDFNIFLSNLEKGFERSFKKGYLFSWDKIPGNDNKRLIKFLKQHDYINWVDSPKIEKIEGNMTIIVFHEWIPISLKLNNEYNKVSLEFIGTNIDELIAKRENNSLKIYKKFNSTNFISYLVEIILVSEEIGIKMVDFISSILEKEENMEDIGFYMSSIARANERIGLKLSSKILEKEEDLEKIAFYLLRMHSEKVKLGLIEIILSKINKEPDIDKISKFFLNFVFKDEELPLKLVNNFDIDILISKIEKEEKIEDIKSIEKILTCATIIADVNTEVGRKFFNRLNPKLKEKLRQFPLYERRIFSNSRFISHRIF